MRSEFNEPLMTGISLGQQHRISHTDTPQQTARYTYDMLMSLKRLAELNKQERLAALIGQAAAEAERVIDNEKSGEK
jgi:hypothetical protein